MTHALREAGFHQPCMVLDMDRLDHNIAAIKHSLAPGLSLRLVDKSLPCLPLLERISKAFDCKQLMTFHLPVTAAVLDSFPDVTVLLGKPMPVEAAKKALMDGVLTRTHGSETRISWLIDSNERLAAYGELSKETGLNLQLCFEVDVGLHRGGYKDKTSLRSALNLLSNYPKLKCNGIMGYEAHINRIPALIGGPKRAFEKARSLYMEFASCLRPDQRSILNIGGSSTALLYSSEQTANELSIGSAFLLPGDFDVPSLSALQPAIFIATPILKVLEPSLPGLDGKSRLLQKIGLFPRHGCFIYGGKWMANPVYPVGMKTNSAMGLSTNQQFMSLPDNTDIQPGDYAFLRPTQSEFVLQQFGSILMYQRKKIVGVWPALPMS
ncbi:alanine racemase [Phyllobacterium sp. YR531]|uniref:alanine racemase n=1 Tax=Phyllobacterium sp. YR531 TaxID=1144343 RepID=UPI0002F23983|nr:alanine racemase [Phyllobacterium sp. YR531]